MSYFTALPIFFVLAVSYSLVLLASRRRISPRVEDYLFEGNRPALAISSGVGSIFSLSIASTSLLAGGYLYGWQIIISLAAGVWVGIFLLFKLFRTRTVQQFKRDLGGNGSFLAMLIPLYGRSFHLVFSAYLLGAYLLMLTLEISLIRLMLVGILPLEATFIVLVAIAMICYSYIFIGGYRGVLLTDHFQFLLIALLATVFGSYVDFVQLFSTMPGPAAGATKWLSVTQIGILHLSAFFGGILFSTGSLDQWYRTAGTLSLEESRRVLVVSAAIYCVGGTFLVFIGSMAYSLGLRPEGHLNQISMDLLIQVVNSASWSLRVAMLLILTCVVLTTIDTYLITIQQIYHEVTIKNHRSSEKTKWLNWVLRQNKIRTLAAIALGLSVLAAFGLNQTAVYRYGLVVLSTPGFVAPLLILHAFPQSNLLNARALLAGLGLSLALFPLSLWLLISVQGPFDLHLYIICGAVFLAVILGYGATGLSSHLYSLRKRRSAS